MKEYGKIKNYNGVYGAIMGEDGINYTLLDRNVLDENIKAGDIVEFEKENIKREEVELNIARFVKVKKL